MQLFQIAFCLLAALFIIRGLKLFVYARKESAFKESIIALALVLMHGLIFARSLLIIQAGLAPIIQAGLLMAYYLYLGTIVLNFLVSDFVIQFVYDRITKTTES